MAAHTHEGPHFEGEALRDYYPEIEPSSTGFLKVGDGHEVYYEVCGNAHGLPVLFVRKSQAKKRAPTNWLLTEVSLARTRSPVAVNSPWKRRRPWRRLFSSCSAFFRPEEKHDCSL